MSTYRLFPSTNGPSTPIDYGGVFQSGVQFSVSSYCWFSGYWWWVCPNPSASNGSQPTAPQKFALWEPYQAGSEGYLIPNSVVTSGTLSAGWNYIPLPTPIPLSVGGIRASGAASYIASTAFTGPFPDSDNTSGDAVHSFGSNGYTNGITQGPLLAFSGTGLGASPPSGIDQGIFGTGSTDPTWSMPQGASNNLNCWIDVQVSTTAPTNYAGSYRLWPDYPLITPNLGVSNDTGEETTGVIFSLSQTCKLDKIWLYSPGLRGSPVAQDLPTRTQIWNTSNHSLVASTDIAATWKQAQTWFGQISINGANSEQAEGRLDPQLPQADTTKYTMGNEFSLSESAPLTAIWFYSPTGAGVLPTACAIYDVGSTSILSGTQNSSPSWINSYGSTAAPGDGWIKCAYPGTTTLAASTPYIVAVQGGDGTHNWYSESSPPLPYTGGIITFTAYEYAGGVSSLTYPTNSGTGAIFGVDVEVTASGASVIGNGWIYSDYTGANISLPAGAYIATVYHPTGGQRFYSEQRGYFGSYDFSDGHGVVAGVGSNGLTFGPLSSPSNAAAIASYGFGNTCYFTGGSGSPTYPNDYDVNDGGENRWIDVEVTASAVQSANLMMASIV